MSPAGELRWLRAWQRDPDRKSPFLAAATHEERVALTLLTDAWVDLGSPTKAGLEVSAPVAQW